MGKFTFINKKIFFTMFSSLSLCSSLNAAKLIAVGDMHLDRKWKNHYIEFMLKMKGMYSNIDRALFLGDLTNSNRIYSQYSGTWGKEQVQISDHGQWGNLIKYWVNPLMNAGIEVFMGPGNHDLYRFVENKEGKLQPVSVVDLLKYHYQGYDHNFTKSDLAYVFKNKNTYFICCGVYPNRDILEWLKKYLKNTVKDNPVFLYLHYPVCGKKGPTGFRDKFYNAIKDYNVKGIFNGHVNSFTHIWRDKKIPIFSCGGESFGVVHYSAKTGEINFDKTFFVNVSPNTSSTYKIISFFDPIIYNISEIFG